MRLKLISKKESIRSQFGLVLGVNAISDRVVDTASKQKRREKSNRRVVNKNLGRI